MRAYAAAVLLVAGLAPAMRAEAQAHAHHQASPSTTLAPPPVDATQHAQHDPTQHEGMQHEGMQHDAPQHEGMQHEGMQREAHPGTEAAGLPRTPVPPLTDADRLAARKPAHDHAVHDNGIHSFVLLNRLEGFDADPGRGFAWEGQSWIGTDLHKLRLRTEGERDRGRATASSHEILYGRAVAPRWDVVAGVRHDIGHGAGKDYVALGVVGLAPYKFEVEATAYAGTGGQAGARVEVAYETLLTNRLVLQPLVELNAYARDDARRGIGSGLAEAQAGLRLRYEITRQFAPYIGVVRNWSLGRTGEFARAAGEASADTRVVAGLRIWF